MQEIGQHRDLEELGSEEVSSGRKTSVVLVEPGEWLLELPRKGHEGQRRVVSGSGNRQTVFFS